MPYMSQQYCIVTFKQGTQQENAATKDAVTRCSFDCSVWQSEYLVKGMKRALLHSETRNLRSFKARGQAAKFLFMRYLGS